MEIRHIQHVHVHASAKFIESNCPLFKKRFGIYVYVCFNLFGLLVCVCVMTRINFNVNIFNLLFYMVPPFAASHEQLCFSIQTSKLTLNLEAPAAYIRTKWASALLNIMTEGPDAFKIPLRKSSVRRLSGTNQPSTGSSLRKQVLTRTSTPASTPNKNRKRHHRRTSTFITKLMISKNPHFAALASFVRNSREALGADRGRLYLAFAEKKELRSLVLEGELQEDITVPFHKGLVGTFVNNNNNTAENKAKTATKTNSKTTKSVKILRIADAYADKRFDPSHDKRFCYKTTSVICGAVYSHSQEATNADADAVATGGGLVSVLQFINKQDHAFKKGWFTVQHEEIMRKQLQALTKLLQDLSYM